MTGSAARAGGAATTTTAAARTTVATSRFTGNRLSVNFGERSPSVLRVLRRLFRHVKD
jgi:hypothetical protein